MKCTFKIWDIGELIRPAIFVAHSSIACKSWWAENIANDLFFEDKKRLASLISMVIAAKLLTNRVFSNLWTCELVNLSTCQLVNLWTAPTCQLHRILHKGEAFKWKMRSCQLKTRIWKRQHICHQLYSYIKEYKRHRLYSSIEEYKRWPRSPCPQSVHRHWGLVKVMIICLYL